MKKYKFYYVISSHKWSNKKGGYVYTAAVYALEGGEMVQIGDVTACTASHYDAETEVLKVIKEQRPKCIKLLERKLSAVASFTKNVDVRYYNRVFEQYGFKIRQL